MRRYRTPIAAMILALLLGCSPAPSIEDADRATATSDVTSSFEAAELWAADDPLPPRPDPDPADDDTSDPDTDRDGPILHEVTPARPATAPAEPAVPTRVRIDALAISAALDPVGLAADGGMEVPHDVSRVGWYEPGVVPGATDGTAVLAGHVDSRQQGRGALWRLRDAGVGQTITVDHEDGTATSWRITDRTTYPKAALPIGELFTRFGDQRLVLITCGGTFDRARGSYTHNVVVTAVPVEPA